MTFSYFFPGVFFLVMGIREMIQVRRIVGRGVKTTGIVVDIIEGNDNSSDYFPIIEYTVKSGEKYRKASRYHWNEAEQNQLVGIYYDPNQPEEIVENTTYATLLAPSKGIVYGMLYFVLVKIFQTVILKP